ncbi:MAG: N-acetyltransferase [Rhodospirillaceae bacterium]|nr:N-acetyltransferase [Rhodospirillaceae bacterium]
MIVYRPEAPHDNAAIETLLDLTFGSERHLKKSYRFRKNVPPLSALCWVAHDTAHNGARLVGTIRYWPIRVGPAGVPSLLLGPLGVAPERRGEGIGVTLVMRTMELARQAGVRTILLVGDLGYYARFGFEPAAPHGYRMPGEDPKRLQIEPLVPSALHEDAGLLRPATRATIVALDAEHPTWSWIERAVG